MSASSLCAAAAVAAGAGAGAGACNFMLLVVTEWLFLLSEVLFGPVQGPKMLCLRLLLEVRDQDFGLSS